MTTMDLYYIIGLIILSLTVCFGPYYVPEAEPRGQ